MKNWLAISLGVAAVLLTAAIALSGPTHNGSERFQLSVSLLSLLLIALAIVRLDAALMGYLVFLAWSPTLADVWSLPTGSARLDDVVLVALTSMALMRYPSYLVRVVASNRALFASGGVVLAVYFSSWILNTISSSHPFSARDALVVAASVKGLVLATTVSVVWRQRSFVPPLTALLVGALVPTAVAWLQFNDGGRMTDLLVAWYPNTVSTSPASDPEYLRWFASYRAFATFWGDANSFGVFEAITAMCALLLASTGTRMLASVAAVAAGSSAYAVLLSGSRMGAIVLVAAACLANVVLFRHRLWMASMAGLAVTLILVSLAGLPPNLVARWTHFLPGTPTFHAAIERELSQKLSVPVPAPLPPAPPAAVPPSSTGRSEQLNLEGRQADRFDAEALKTLLVGRGPFAELGYVSDIWYVQLFVRRGALGLVALALLVLALLRLAWSAARSQIEAKPLAIFILVLVPVLLAANVSGNYLDGTRIRELLWVIVGCILAQNSVPQSPVASVSSAPRS